MQKNQSVTAVVFSEDRKQVLLIKRRDVPVWVLPGGGIEKDETLENATLREVLEETGYTTKIYRKVGEYTPINKLSKFTHLYECEIISGKAAISDETREVNFFDIENLPKLIPPPYPEWIDDANKNEKSLIKRELKSVNYLSLIKNLFLHPILVIRFLMTKVGLTINS
ncbi:MAG: RNA pyrophosphohydrolase [Candidatus Anoxychlamydiales bacterium]|nr:RNA pyrophosphohydrolase [Candidatus Anoxychlamydiales bacterium]NGX35594.1 RNA pyrophosphohydrolase [Candidatus Anoxychlamydiales bacterium]